MIQYICSCNWLCCTPSVVCISGHARPNDHRLSAVTSKQVRLKLLPLLLEWDMRQGPHPGPSSGVQFRPTGIRKVSSKGADDMSGVPARQQQGWRYVLLVERLQQQQQQGPNADAEDADAEDLPVDLAWIAGTARSRPPKLASFASAAAAAGDDGDADGELCLSQVPASQGPSFSCSQAAPASQAAAGSGGGRSGGSLQFSEHRSVRCSLVEAVWPELVAAYRCGQGVDSQRQQAHALPSHCRGRTSSACMHDQCDIVGSVCFYDCSILLKGLLCWHAGSCAMA
jgi:hypothetical protein